MTTLVHWLSCTWLPLLCVDLTQIAGCASPMSGPRTGGPEWCLFPGSAERYSGRLHKLRSRGRAGDGELGYARA
jgi:hypothetical protein